MNVIPGLITDLKKLNKNIYINYNHEEIEIFCIRFVFFHRLKRYIIII